MRFSLLQRTLFWLGYIVFNIVQLYFSFYNFTSRETASANTIISAAIIDIWPKIFLDILVFYFVTLPLLLKQRKLAFLIARSLIFILTALLVQRALNYYFTFPEIYRYKMEGTSYFTVSSLVVTLFDMLVPVSLLLIFDLYRFAGAIREKENQMEKEKLLSEMKYLKAQINPHFLFNVLGTVHALSRNKAPEAAKVVVKLSELMRFILYEAKNRTIRIRREIEFLESYIDLEKMRFQSKLELRFEADVNDENLQIAPMILLPFVENAFKHGVSESRHRSFVHIYLNAKNGILEFKVENSVETLAPGSNDRGIGLANVKRQLELIYPEHSLSVLRTPGNYCITLKIILTGNEKIIVPDH